MNTIITATKPSSFNRFATHLVALLTIGTLVACGRIRKPSVSTTESVDIAQTSIKNQYAAGFCWSYAALAMIESNHKAQTGEDIDLSEEALGYVRMRHELSQVAQKYRAGIMTLEAVTTWLDGRSLEGWFVRNSDTSPTEDAMELIDDYGLVPESAWSLKLKTRNDVNTLKRSIASSFKQFLEGSDPVSDSVLDLVLTSDGAFDSAPPSSFYFNGKRFTATSFARQYLKFSSRDYVLLQAKSASDTEKLISALKRAMAAGFSIPISFGVSMKNLKAGFFSATDRTINELDSNPDIASEIINLTGNHAVIATDFVNRGGVEGAIPLDQLKLEVQKPVHELSYLKLKNSWGAQASTTENGDDVISSNDGYYRMDYAYIKAVAAKGKFGVVVPRTFAP